MRYVIAIIFAVLGGVFVAAQLAAPMTSSIVADTKFESPDQVEDLHSMLMIGFALLGAFAGWLLGWFVGGFFDHPPKNPAAKPEN